MELNEYQNIVAGIGRCEYMGGFRVNQLLGISSEAGEVQDVYKKHLERGWAIDKALLVKELGDVLWYVQAIAYQEGISLEEVAQVNIKKLSEKYPRA